VGNQREHSSLALLAQGCPHLQHPNLVPNLVEAFLLHALRRQQQTRGRSGSGLTPSLMGMTLMANSSPLARAIPLNTLP